MRAHGWYDRRRRLQRDARRAHLCAARGCESQGRHLLEGRKFCRRHWHLYLEHYRIVQRIRDIPNLKIEL